MKNKNLIKNSGHKQERERNGEQKLTKFQGSKKIFDGLIQVSTTQYEEELIMLVHSEDKELEGKG